MTKTDKNLLLIFVKNPKRGHVKTRLAESVGEEEALRIYRQLLRITKSVSDKLNCIRQVWYSDFIDGEDLWSTGDYEKRLQKGSNLGERMKQAFRQVFADGYEKAIIIGSDCAALKYQIIEHSFKALDRNDAVIGPSEDGGYYLLGMSEFYPNIFDGINWSTSTVFEATIAKVEELDLSVQLMPQLNDIDTIEDLRVSDIERN